MSYASAIYSGTVAHRRLRPRQHALKYRAFWMLFDMDELPELGKSLRFFSHNGFSLFGFHDRDHGNGSGRPLRQWVEGHLKEAGVAVDGGPIRLLCMPRILGYVFNPISVYFCYLKDGTLNAIVYEVNNTFGQRHSYLIPVDPGTGRTIQQTCSKQLYVSPFNDMDMSYDFKVQPPEGTVTVGVDALDKSGLMIATALHGTRSDFTDRALVRAFLSHPLLTLKVIVAIHWEALQLWLKGMKITERPPGPEQPVSLGSGAAGK
jgi:DUF1365 family protein